MDIELECSDVEFDRGAEPAALNAEWGTPVRMLFEDGRLCEWWWWRLGEVGERLW